MSKLIILRGPSASGKSTVAQLLKNSTENHTVVLDFDVYRMDFLDRQGDYYPVASKMLISDAAIALEAGYDVIIDGFYRPDSFPNLLNELIDSKRFKNYMFYFDISLKETIKRHTGREKSDAISVEELKKWYYKPESTNLHNNEHRINEEASAEETVEFIISKLKS